MWWQIKSSGFVLLVWMLRVFVSANSGHVETFPSDVINDFRKLFDRVDELENREKSLVGQIKEMEMANHVFGDRIAKLEQHNRFLVSSMKKLETKTDISHNKIIELQNQNQLQQRIIDKLTSDIAMQNAEIQGLKTKVARKDIIKSSKLFQSRNPDAQRTQDGRNNNGKKTVDLRNNQTALVGSKKRRNENELTVAFSAAMVRSMLNMEPNQNIVFGHVKTNIGNAYSPHQGVFIAPVTGIYVFHATLSSSPSITVNCKIAVNGTGRALLFTNAPKTGYLQSSQMIIVGLTKGETVSVQNYFQEGGVHADPAFGSTFSGFLLTQNYDPSGIVVVSTIRRGESAAITVAFTAALGSRMVNLGQNQNIVLEHVETNIGNSYNPHQGVFTAPVAGTYVFHSSLLSDPSYTVNCKIAANGTGRGELYTNNLKTGLFQSSQMVIVRLTQGDDVSVQNMVSGDGVYSDHDFASTFSGFLLSQNYDQPGTIVG